MNILCKIFILPIGSGHDSRPLASRRVDHGAARGMQLVSVGAPGCAGRVVLPGNSVGSPLRPPGNDLGTSWKIEENLKKGGFPNMEVPPTSFDHISQCEPSILGCIEFRNPPQIEYFLALELITRGVYFLA